MCTTKLTGLKQHLRHDGWEARLRSEIGRDEQQGSLEYRRVYRRWRLKGFGAPSSRLFFSPKSMRGGVLSSSYHGPSVHFLATFPSSHHSPSRRDGSRDLAEEKRSASYFVSKFSIRRPRTSTVGAWIAATPGSSAGTIRYFCAGGEVAAGSSSPAACRCDGKPDLDEMTRSSSSKVSGTEFCGDHYLASRPDFAATPRLSSRTIMYFCEREESLVVFEKGRRPILPGPVALHSPTPDSLPTVYLHSRAPGAGRRAQTCRGPLGTTSLLDSSCLALNLARHLCRRLDLT